MPIHICWDNAERTILRVGNEGQWTWEEYHATANMLVDLIRSVPHRIDIVIIDLPDASMPAGTPIPHFKQAAKMLPENTGLQVVISNNLAIRAMVSMFNRLPGNLIPAAYRMAATLEEAYAMIRKDASSSQSVKQL